MSWDPQVEAESVDWWWLGITAMEYPGLHGKTRREFKERGFPEVGMVVSWCTMHAMRCHAMAMHAT